MNIFWAKYLHISKKKSIFAPEIEKQTIFINAYEERFILWPHCSSSNVGVV